MSTLTPQEKRKILQERRAAKMKGGKASERLNTILTQGSSVKSDTVTSVLDKSPSPDASSTPTPSGKTEAPTTTASIPATTTDPISHSGPTPVATKPTSVSRAHQFDDPDTSDIEQLLSHRVSPAPNAFANSSEPDLDEMLNKMFGGSGANSSEQDPIASMMMNMMKQQQQTDGESTSDPTYEAQLLKYNMYKQKQLKYRFLLVRFVSVIANFWYHYMYVENFTASSYAYIREAVVPRTNFAVVFASLEVAILSSFYIITTRRRVSENVSEDNLLLKGVSMLSMVVPVVQNYQPLIIQAVKYYELFSMLLGDLALVVVLFGIFSA